VTAASSRSLTVAPWAWATALTSASPARTTASRRRPPTGRRNTDRGLVTYMIAWPYHCPGQASCPPAARWRVLQLEAEGEGAGWPEAQRVVRRLVETVGPVTNALPGGPFQPEEPGLFAEPFKLIASGGQGDFVWEASAARRSGTQQGYWAEIHFPKFNGMGSTLGQIPATCRQQ
jgi:hypothetical protein